MFKNHALPLWLLSLGYIFSGLHARADTNDPIDPWTVDSGPINPRHYFGEVLANGWLGITASPRPFHTEQTLLYGAYERYWPGSVSGLVRQFNFLNLHVSVNGKRIDRADELSNSHQRMDFRKAVLTAAFDYDDSVSVIYAVRVLRQQPNLALMEVSVHAHTPSNLEVMSELAVPSSKGAVAMLEHRPAFSWLTNVRRFRNLSDFESPGTLKIAAASAKGPSGVLSIAAAQGFLFEQAALATPEVTYEKKGLRFRYHLEAGQTLHFALIGAAMTSAEVADPVNAARRLTRSAAQDGLAKLVERHEEAWSDLWQSDITIEGDPATQRAVHSMLYHLYSFVREGSGYSIPPMGLSGGGSDYLGHIFWDAETWMLPPLLALHPELARTLLDYRFDRLGAARRNAMLNGYRGAQFPWESAASGDEDIWGEFSARELHITADVALAAWDYYRVTQDKEWLRTRGMPLIKEAADFWVSQVTRTAPGEYDITHVVAADEYAEDVDNDAFTNAAVRATLAAATSAAQVLGEKSNPEWDLVRTHIGIMQFPSGVTREHARYQGERIKQADVNLLAYPLHEITDPDQIRQDLDYYSSRVDDAHGPAMTKSIFAILYQRLGLPEKAVDFFKAGYEPNLRPPFGVLAESVVSDNPYFATGAGGSLQALIFGFGGLETTDSGLTQRPRSLPSRWRYIKLTGIGPQKLEFVSH